MIGIFDSGVGGLVSMREVRRLLPRENIFYLADRRNAPYGTKTKEELKELVLKNLSTLCDMGARSVLVACCTASTVLPSLPEEFKSIAYSIIPKSAEIAAGLGSRITVIATDYTVSTHTFREEIRAYNPSATVTEIAAQGLVPLVEGGARDGELSEENRSFTDSLAEKIKESSPDVLVLGCTHFSYLEGELKSRLGNVHIVTPAIIGANDFVNEYRSANLPSGRGRTVYL